MTTNTKSKKIKTYLRKDMEKIKLLIKLLELPSSWTALVLNEKLWMRKMVFIGKISTWLGLLVAKNSQKMTFPKSLGAPNHVSGACAFHVWASSAPMHVSGCFCYSSWRLAPLPVRMGVSECVLVLKFPFSSPF